MELFLYVASDRFMHVNPLFNYELPLQLTQYEYHWLLMNLLYLSAQVPINELLATYNE